MTSWNLLKKIHLIEINASILFQWIRIEIRKDICPCVCLVLIFSSFIKCLISLFINTYIILAWCSEVLIYSHSQSIWPGITSIKLSDDFPKSDTCFCNIQLFFCPQLRVDDWVEAFPSHVKKTKAWKQTQHVRTPQLCRVVGQCHCWTVRWSQSEMERSRRQKIRTRIGFHYKRQQENVWPHLLEILLWRSLISGT